MKNKTAMVIVIVVSILLLAGIGGYRMLKSAAEDKLRQTIELNAADISDMATLSYGKIDVNPLSKSASISDLSMSFVDDEIASVIEKITVDKINLDRIDLDHKNAAYAKGSYKGINIIWQPEVKHTVFKSSLIDISDYSMDMEFDYEYSSASKTLDVAKILINYGGLAQLEMGFKITDVDLDMLLDMTPSEMEELDREQTEEITRKLTIAKLANFRIKYTDNSLIPYAMNRVVIMADIETLAELIDELNNELEQEFKYNPLLKDSTASIRPFLENPGVISFKLEPAEPMLFAQIPMNIQDQEAMGTKVEILPGTVKKSTDKISGIKVDHPGTIRAYFPANIFKLFSTKKDDDSPVSYMAYVGGEHTQKDGKLIFRGASTSIKGGELRNTSVSKFYFNDDLANITEREVYDTNYGRRENTIIFSTGNPYLIFPLKEGNKKSFRYTSENTMYGKTQTRKVDISVLGDEKLTVASGEFDCQKIEYRYFNDGKELGTITRWMAEGVGTVKFVQVNANSGSTATSVLQEMSPKKDGAEYVKFMSGKETKGAFSGQREKAKLISLEASAKGSVTELQAALDDYVSKTSMIFYSSSSEEMCIEHIESSARRSCMSLYNMPAGMKYSSMEEVINVIVTHHNEGREEVSPYDGTPLFVTDPEKKAGHILVEVKSDQKVNLSVWAYDDPRFPIFNAPISSR